MTWHIDPAHSRIYFTARHMMIAKVRGRFEKFHGVLAYDESNPAATTVDITIDADSINTEEEKRDNHLRSADFLSVAEFPVITFKSSRLEQLDVDHGRLHGDLTIRGVTRPVVLDVEHNGTVQNPWGSQSAGFTASTRIKRQDWGLNWNVALEAGGWLVGDQVTIDIELELVKQPEAEWVAA